MEKVSPHVHINKSIEFIATAGKAKDALLILKDFIIAYGLF
jgi:hypothetical protein